MFNKVFLFLCLISVSASLTAKELNIAVVNMNKLNYEAPQIKQMEAEMKKRFSAPEAELNKMAQSLKQMEQDLKQNELLMTPDKLNKAKQDLMSKAQQFQGQKAKLQKELTTVRNNMLTEFGMVVRKVLADLAKEEKYDLILAEGILYVDDKLNITAKILERLKKQVKK